MKIQIGPRRVTPTEAERFMGLSDGWDRRLLTLVGKHFVLIADVAGVPTARRMAPGINVRLDPLGERMRHRLFFGAWIEDPTDRSLRFDAPIRLPNIRSWRGRLGRLHLAAQSTDMLMERLRSKALAVIENDQAVRRLLAIRRAVTSGRHVEFDTHAYFRDLLLDLRGACPAQLEGTIDGEQFRFRLRGDRAVLRVYDDDGRIIQVAERTSVTGEKLAGCFESFEQSVQVIASLIDDLEPVATTNT